MENTNELKPGTKEFLKAENEAQKAELEALKAELEALKAEPEAVTAQKADAPEPAEDDHQAPAPKAARKVTIKIPLTRTEKDDVFVALNGKTYLIKRGVEVTVPEGVAKILERKEKMLAVAMEYEAAAAAPLDQLAQMYNK